MGELGLPNFSLTAAMNVASRCASHRQKAPHAEQMIRCACGPLEVPMTPMMLPQLGQARGIWTRKPIIDEDDDDGAASGGGDSNKSSCKA
jgi:hypothetical protein